jgi:predicted transcriptional regulator of viral defense system
VQQDFGGRVEVTTPTGSVRVSTPAMTMLDLVAYPVHAAGWGNIASILPDLAPLANRKGWADALSVEPRATDVQRLGHLLDRAGLGRTDVLAAWLAKRPIEPTLLVPGGESAGDYDARWRVIVNAAVTAD